MVEREGTRRGSGSGSGGGCGWGGGVLGRWSLRRLLLDSPLVGRRLAHTVLDQTESRQVKLSSVETQSRQQPVEYVADFDEGEVVECPLCLSAVSGSNMVRLAWCVHHCCEPCLRQYLAIEIFEARVPVSCPVCFENMHPLDVRRIVDNPVLYEKYEEFSLRRALAADPDTRWCPAPDCSFAVVATGCASCPKLTCLAPGCGATFCYHCKAAWHPTQTCDAARRSRQPPPSRQSHAPQPSHADLDHGEVKPCPRCSVLIVKVEDGSCNHMVCCVCGSEFCWLCMKEVSDLHYLSPSGCTFWGKKPWSRKKKLLWQLGTLAGAPVGIAVVAGVALPALLVGLPLWAGRRAHRAAKHHAPHKRRAAVAAAVAAALLVSPVVAGLAVGIGVPILLFYVYGVVPVSLCRAGGCGGPPSSHAAPPAGAPDDVDAHLDAASRRLDPSIGDASLSATSQHAFARAASLAALAGSLAAEPSPTPPRNVQVHADVANDSVSAHEALSAPYEALSTPHEALSTHEPLDTHEAALHMAATHEAQPAAVHSWTDPSDVNECEAQMSYRTSRSARLRSLFLYGTAPPPPPPPDLHAARANLDAAYTPTRTPTTPASTTPAPTTPAPNTPTPTTHDAC